MARNVSTSPWWSAGRVLSSVTYSFIAQKLRNAKKTSDSLLLTSIAPKKTTAIIHHARTRACSSEKSLCGRARRIAKTAVEASTSTDSTTMPICHMGPRFFTADSIITRIPFATRSELLKVYSNR